MAERKITFVDTTMRDGSHAVRHSFTKEQVSQIAARLDKCGVPLIELSHGDGLGGSSYTYGLSKKDEVTLMVVAAK